MVVAGCATGWTDACDDPSECVLQAHGECEDHETVEAGVVPQRRPHAGVVQGHLLQGEVVCRIHEPLCRRL